MNDFDKLKAFGEISPEYVEQAAKLGRRRPLRSILTAAASLLVTAGMVFGFCTALKKQEEKAAHAEPTAVATEAAEPTPAETVEPAEPDPERQKRLRDNAEAAAEIPEVPASVHSNSYYKYYRDIRAAFLGGADGLTDFFKLTIPEFLLAGEENENAAYSPLNLYMALSMMAETAGGETREEILELLGAESIEALREQANKLFIAHYYDNDVLISRPAASVWVNGRFGGALKAEALKNLSAEHHASVYKGDMEAPEFVALFRDWMNESTGGLLEDQIKDMEFWPEEMMRIVSAIYFKACWQNKFYEDSDTEGVFRSPTGEETVTFMHGGGDSYFDCEGFTMVGKGLVEGGYVYFALPDEGTELEELVSSGAVMEELLSNSNDHYVSGAIIHLHLPKFDVESQLGLKQGLMKLGIKKIFTLEADLTPLTELDGVYVSSVEHGVRVMVDEEGVSAAAYVMMFYAGSAPPSIEVDFTLDRPFMFVVMGPENVPLFVGTVYHPQG